MSTISSLEPTRYEITARHPDGRELLICYAAGSPSRRRLQMVILQKSRLLLDGLQLSDDLSMQWQTKPRPHILLADWRIGYTGRTQRDVRAANEREHPLLTI